MRLIDADALVRHYSGNTVFVLEQTIDTAPTVDAVEVVRCKDCKHSDTIDDCTEAALLLMCRGTRYGAVMPYWFCEHGKPKNGGEEDADGD